MSVENIYTSWLKSGAITVTIFDELEGRGLVISNKAKDKIVKDVTELLIKKAKDSFGKRSMTDIRSVINKIKSIDNDGRPSSTVRIACRAKLIREVFEFVKEWDCDFEHACKMISDNYKAK